MFEKFLFRFVATLVAVALLGTVSQAVIIETVPVGDPGNAADDTTRGRVDYAYRIGKYEVTNLQYAEFLNAMAKDDPNGLYNGYMRSGWNDIGGISRSGDPGSYEYAVRENRGNRPVNYVSWYDTLRFANWLHNGQPAGAQGPSTTEDGAYDMSLGSSVVRKPGARVFLPNDDEWYKAAYYKGGGTNAGYWDSPTQGDTAPTADEPPGADMHHGSANYIERRYVDTTYYTTEVGAYNARPSDSAYGTFDQGGNSWEWEETMVSSQRGLMGGAFTFESRYMLASAHFNIQPTSQNNDVGFRVASVSPIPEPGSLAMLAGLALTGLLYWWRRRA